MTHVGAAWIFYNDKLLLIQHVKTGRWLPVGGHAEGTESPLETTKREVSEEVNLEPVFISLWKDQIIPFFIHTNHLGEMTFDFLARIDDVSSLSIQNEELQDFRWSTLEEIESADDLMDKIKQIASVAFSLFLSQK